MADFDLDIRVNYNQAAKFITGITRAWDKELRTRSSRFLAIRLHSRIWQNLNHKKWGQSKSHNTTVRLNKLVHWSAKKGVGRVYFDNRNMGDGKTKGLDLLRYVEYGTRQHPIKSGRMKTGDKRRGKIALHPGARPKYNIQRGIKKFLKDDVSKIVTEEVKLIIKKSAATATVGTG